MSYVSYLVAPCTGGTTSIIEFNGSSLPAVGGNYFLTSTGQTVVGCYEIVDTAEPGTGCMGGHHGEHGGDVADG